MDKEKLRADIKRELSWVQPTVISELLNRCYVALGEQQVQEGQYDDELHEAWQSRLIGLIKSYRAADDGSEVRDAFRAITAHIEVQPMSMTMLPAEAQAGLVLQRNEMDRLKQQLRAEGDRIAELNAKLGGQQSVPDADALAQSVIERLELRHIELHYVEVLDKLGNSRCVDAEEYLVVALKEALAAAPKPPVQDVFTELRKDAENWGSSLNDSGWVFTENCPEKSGLLFNNTKRPLRAAILNYLELEQARLSAVAPQPSDDVAKAWIPPAICRQRLRAEGKPYNRSGCAVCGQLAPKWKECDAAMAGGGV